MWKYKSKLPGRGFSGEDEIRNTANIDKFSYKYCCERKWKIGAVTRVAGAKGLSVTWEKPGGS